MTRDEQIINLLAKELVSPSPNNERYIALTNNVNEGEGNGAWVKAWVWIDFKGTDLDKEP